MGLPVLADEEEGGGQQERRQDRRADPAGGDAAVHRGLHGPVPAAQHDRGLVVCPARDQGAAGRRGRAGGQSALCVSITSAGPRLQLLWPSRPRLGWSQRSRATAGGGCATFPGPMPVWPSRPRLGPGSAGEKPLAKPTKSEHRRNLPHLQVEGKTYYVTFCTHNRWTLPEEIRPLVVQHCLHDHGTKLHMHALVVMPDHVHLIFTPMADPSGSPYGLSEILGGIKGASAHTINKRLARKGPVWQDESFDHILRREEKLEQKVEYIRQNPVRKGLVAKPEDYPYTWVEGSVPLEDPVAQPPSAVHGLEHGPEHKAAQPRAAVPHSPGVAQPPAVAQPPSAGLGSTDQEPQPRAAVPLAQPGTGPSGRRLVRRLAEVAQRVHDARPVLRLRAFPGGRVPVARAAADARRGALARRTPAMPCSARTCSASNSTPAAPRSPRSPWPWRRGPTRTRRAAAGISPLADPEHRLLGSGRRRLEGGLGEVRGRRWSVPRGDGAALRPVSECPGSRLAASIREP